MNCRKVLVVIDPASHTPEVDCFNKIATAAPLPATYHLPALFGENSLLAIDPKLIGGIMILGSSTSVGEELPWQLNLKSWLTMVIEGPEEVPILGICFGHQLLAAMFGASLGFFDSNQTKLQGFRVISFKDNKWTRAKSGQVCVSHREIVTTLPTELRTIASSNELEVEAFEHLRKPIWGVQAHPEATQEFLCNQEIALPIGTRNPFSYGHKLINDFLEKLNT